MTQPSDPRAELRALIEHALSTDDPVGALMRHVHYVNDEWDEIDLTTLGEYPGSSLMWNRYLVVRIPREGVRRKPDRTVERNHP